MKKSTYRVRLAPWISLAAASSMTGCGNMAADVDRIASQNAAHIRDAEVKATKPIPVVTRSGGAWLLGQAVPVYVPPSPQLARPIVYRPSGRIALSDLATYISQKTGLQIDTSEVWTPNTNTSPNSAVPQPPAMAPIVPSLSGPLTVPTPPGVPTNAAQQPLFEVAYEGTVAGLLDLAANKNGVWWRYADGRVTFFREDTRTFVIPALNTSTTGGSSIRSGVSGSGSSASAGGTGTTTTTDGGTNSTSSYTVDIWKDLEKTAQTIGGSARVVTNPTLGSITVTGTPAQVRNVEEWAKALTESLSQQVQISVSVFRVDISREEHFSWNPTVIFNSITGDYGVSLTAPQAPTITSGTAPMSFSTSVLTTATGHAARFSGSQLAFRALSSLGNTSIVYSRTLVSLNRHAAPLQVANIEGYLASRTPSGATPVGSTPLPPTITPGTITTGFMANFVPVIANGRILLSADMTISSNKGFIPLGSADSFIQAVNVGQATFSTTSSLTPGDAILLTGYTQESGSTNNAGVGAPSFALLGGGTSRNTNKQMLAIVVEAKVL